MVAQNWVLQFYVNIIFSWVPVGAPICVFTLCVHHRKCAFLSVVTHCVLNLCPPSHIVFVLLREAITNKMFHPSNNLGTPYVVLGPNKPVGKHSSHYKLFWLGHLTLLVRPPSPKLGLFVLFL
jgi:hypothetical protein